MTAICTLRDRMFDLFEHNAKGLDGSLVVRALKNASHNIWESGIDHAYEGSNQRTTLEFATAFDLTWLTQVNVELTAQRKKRGLPTGDER